MEHQASFPFAPDVTVPSRKQTEPHFEGPADEPDRAKRLTAQQEDIKRLMSDRLYRTLEEIHEATGHPVASISAQLRHLRKPRFGSWRVEKQHMGHGLWAYRVLPPED